MVRILAKNRVVLFEIVGYTGRNFATVPFLAILVIFSKNRVFGTFAILSNYLQVWMGVLPFLPFLIEKTVKKRVQSTSFSHHNF